MTLHLWLQHSAMTTCLC